MSDPGRLSFQIGAGKWGRKGQIVFWGNRAIYRRLLISHPRPDSLVVTRIEEEIVEDIRDLIGDLTTRLVGDKGRPAISCLKFVLWNIIIPIYGVIRLGMTNSCPQILRPYRLGIWFGCGSFSKGCGIQFQWVQSPFDSSFRGRPSQLFRLPRRSCEDASPRGGRERGKTPHWWVPCLKIKRGKRHVKNNFHPEKLFDPVHA